MRPRKGQWAAKSRKGGRRRGGCDQGVRGVGNGTRDPIRRPWRGLATRRAGWVARGQWAASLELLSSPPPHPLQTLDEIIDPRPPLAEQLQTHYDNANMVAGRFDSSGVKVRRALPRAPVDKPGSGVCV